MVDKPFAVGDKVTIHAPYGRGAFCVTTVEKVGKRQMTLAGQSAWRVNGCGRPGSDGYSNSLVRHWRPEDDESIRRKRLLAEVGEFEFNQLSTDCLDAIATVISRAQAGGA